MSDALSKKFQDFEKRIKQIQKLRLEVEHSDFLSSSQKNDILKLLKNPDNIDKAQTLFNSLEKLKFKDSSDKTEDELSIEDAKSISKLLRAQMHEISKIVIGQDSTIERVIIALMCDGHALLEGVPGLAKSLLVETLSQTMKGTSFHRIQFLPDLLPSDIIGGQIFNPKTAQFQIFKGPIFANFILADEINRAPPKTHAALMEAMQEKKITIDKSEFVLDRPFLVLATQNPLENKGTYVLPEAVLDRFIFKIILDYPTHSAEKRIITENATTKKNLKKGAKPIIDKLTFLNMQKKVKSVFISDKIREYIIKIVEATRGVNKEIEGFKFVKYGAGPRASIYLGIAAKAKALIEGRNYVLPEDVAYVAPDILRHRVRLNYKGKAHNISSDKIIEEILLKVTAI